MNKTLAELAALVNGTVIGDASIVISGIASLTDARSGDITFFTNPRYRRLLSSTQASAVIAAERISDTDLPLIIAPDPYRAYAIIARLCFEKPFCPLGISPQAVIAESAVIGAEPSISPLVFIGEDTVIGDRVVIHPGVIIGAQVRIGNDVILHSNFVLQERSILGDRVILHPGVVIGGDGFGYARDHQGASIKIPQVGIVQIDDDVEIGANSTVDRAALGKTWIKRGAKIDNLVMVAHNVVIGEDTVVVAQSGIAGSTEIGNRVILAAKAGIAGHLHIGDRATVTATGGVHKDVPAGSVVSGRPAIPHRDWLKSKILCSRLPEMHTELKQLKEAVARLEERLEHNKNGKEES